MSEDTHFYCCKDAELNITYWITDDNPCLSLGLEGEFESINYCPFCGKKLR